MILLLPGPPLQSCNPRYPRFIRLLSFVLVFQPQCRLNLLWPWKNQLVSPLLMYADDVDWMLQKAWENHHDKEMWVGMKASNTKHSGMKKVNFSFSLTNPMSKRTEYNWCCEASLLSTPGHICLNVQLLWGRRICGLVNRVVWLLSGRSWHEEWRTTLLFKGFISSWEKNMAFYLIHMDIGGVYRSQKPCNAEYFP